MNHTLLSLHATLLQKELSLLKMSGMLIKDVPAVTHDWRSKLVVIGELEFKAFVPKKFNGWPVEFRENNLKTLKLIEDEFVAFLKDATCLNYP